MHESAGLDLPRVAVGRRIVWRTPGSVAERDNRVLAADVGKARHAGHLPVDNRQVGISLGCIGCAGYAGVGRHVYRECGGIYHGGTIATVQVWVAASEYDSNSRRRRASFVARDGGKSVGRRSDKCNRRAGLAHRLYRSVRQKPTCQADAVRKQGVVVAVFFAVLKNRRSSATLTAGNTENSRIGIDIKVLDVCQAFPKADGAE